LKIKILTNELLVSCLRNSSLRALLASAMYATASPDIRSSVRLSHLRDTLGAIETFSWFWRQI